MMDGDESLNSDGTVRQGVGSDYVAGRYSTSYYTCSGNGVEQWTPSYSYTGGRYVEVTGLPVAPTMDNPEVKWQVARSDNPVTGSVTTSNALLNRILRNGQWSEWNNTVQTETDTPDREKNGWTGDAQIDSLSEMLGNSHDLFATEFMNMLADTQTSGTPPHGVTNPGQISLIAPNPRGEYGTDNPAESSTSWYGPDPEWDAALFMYPWEMYQQYGDTQILSRLWATQQGMLDYYTHYFTPTGTGGVPYAYNSGLSVYSAQGTTGTAGAIVDNLEYYWFFANYMAAVGDKLNHPAEAASYRTLANAVEKSLVDHYWSTASGAAQGGSFISGNIESENGLALALGIVADAVTRGLLPATAPQTVANAIAYDVLNVGSTHIYAGVEGIAPVFQALDRYGYQDLAYQLATQTTSPSYSNQISQGATSMWESWGGGSLDHHYRAAIGQWYYQDLAGISPNLNGTTSVASDPGYFAGGPITSVGYRAVQIMPFVPSVTGSDSVPPTNHATRSTLDNVSGSMQTVRGLVTSAWTRRSDGRIRLTVTIPDNTPATVWVPMPTGTGSVSAPAGATFAGNQTVGANASGALGGTSTRYAVYSVGAGTWTFNADGLQTTASLSPAAIGGYYSNPTVTLTGSDDGGPGVRSTEYRLGTSGDWQPYTGAFKVTGDGTITLQYRSTDRNGLVEAINTMTFDNDATAPVTTASASPSLAGGSVSGGPVTVTLAAADPGSAPAASGLAQTQYALDGATWITYSGPVTIGGEGGHTLLYRSIDNAGNTETTHTLSVVINPTATGGVGGTVPATLALTLGAAPQFGAFTPGVDRTYGASTTATVISTAGDATLTVADPSPTATGHLVNGTFALPNALGGLGVIKTWSAPVSNDVVPIAFTQHIGASDPLRTGTYNKTLTFTLSTTTP